MSEYLYSLENELRENSYPGRGIIIGKSKNERYAVAAYFIMGRSANSRNRIFLEEGEGLRTQAFDPALCTDPSLIIYAPVRVLHPYFIVTNGDQTDTIYDGLKDGKSFEESLREREFEPDAPNYTPRISGLITLKDNSFAYALSILKSSHGNAASCERFTYSYENPISGEGHFIHTYRKDGTPLPSFEGEPKTILVPDEIDQFTECIWKNLNEDNKVSLFVRYLDLFTGKQETRIINKNQ